MIYRIIRASVSRVVVFIVLLVMRFYKCLSFGSDVQVWLVGENRGECLRENGYYFFHYMKAKNSRAKVYFLVKSVSPYYDLALGDSLVRYGSARHAVIFSRAKVLFYTHTYRDLMFRRYFEIFGKNKLLVYLHHGVLGFKRFNEFYRRNRNIMSLFTVGSEREKEILVMQELVDERRVKVTGYSRYDFYPPRLRRREGRVNILYMPTHRNYALRKNSLSKLASVFDSFVSNKMLGSILDVYNAKLSIYMHKEMQRYFSGWSPESSNIEVYDLADFSAGELLSAGDLLITDYSSVSWDFYSMSKPIIFYRFDVDEYLEDRGSYIDLTREDIGDVVWNEAELIDKLQRHLQQNLEFCGRNGQVSDKFMQRLDGGACDRIYNEVCRILN